MADSRGKPNKYEFIAAALRKAIASGVYGPGERMPSEAELMDGFKVSRVTARTALDLLRREGLVYSRRGSGVFVTKAPKARTYRISPTRLDANALQTGADVWRNERVGYDADVEVHSVQEVSATEEIAKLLDVESGTPLLERRRRYRFDGQAVMFVTSYVSMDIARDTRIEKVDTGPGGIYARLAELGHQPRKYREDITARLPSIQEATMLEKPATAPIVAIQRVAYTEEGRPVEVTDAVLDAAAYILRYEFEA